MGNEAEQGSQDPCSPATMLSSLSPSSDPESGTGAHLRRTMLSPYERSSSIVLPCALKSGDSTAPSRLHRSPKRGSGAPIGFINSGSPMDPLPCNTWPSRRRSDSACLGRPRYTMIGQDLDPVPDRHLRPGDLVRAPTGRPGRGGTAVRLRPCSSDQGYAGPLLATLSRLTRSGPTRND